MKSTTLQQVLKKLNSFDPAFKDKTSKGYRIKSWYPLNKKDLTILQAIQKKCSDIIEINNSYVWNGENFTITTFVLRLTKAPSHIVVILDEQKDKTLIQKLDL